jgi:hypothetical protein
VNYRQYLLYDPNWYRLRGEVLVRAEMLCEWCRQRKATTVHHLHYETIGHEEPRDLLAVCQRCHDRLHPVAANDNQLAFDFGKTG